MEGKGREISLVKTRDVPDVSPGFREILSLSLMISPLQLLCHPAAVFSFLTITHPLSLQLLSVLKEKSQIPSELPGDIN